MANTGALPQNQIDALPLLTPAQAVQASTVIRMGGQIYKQFLPTDTGINAANFASFTSPAGAPASEGLLVSNFLDLTYCNRFRILLQRTISNGTAQAAPTVMTVNVQMRAGPSDNPPPTYSSAAGLNADFAGRQQASSTTIGFPAIQAGATQRFSVGWGDSEPGDNISGFQFVALGGNCRILISVGVGGLPGVLELYSMWLDAQT